MSRLELETIPAHAVARPCEVETHEGFAEVVASNPERQSAGSGSTSVWEITYKRPGRPTFRILCAPHAPQRIRRAEAAS